MIEKYIEIDLKKIDKISINKITYEILTYFRKNSTQSIPLGISNHRLRIYLLNNNENFNNKLSDWLKEAYGEENIYEINTKHQNIDTPENSIIISVRLTDTEDTKRSIANILDYCEKKSLENIVISQSYDKDTNYRITVTGKNDDNKKLVNTIVNDILPDRPNYPIISYDIIVSDKIISSGGRGK